MNKKDLSERDICSKFIGPAVKRAGWDGMMQIREEVAFTKGRVIVRGKLVTRGKAKRAGLTCCGTREGFGFQSAGPKARTAIPRRKRRTDMFRCIRFWPPICVHGGRKAPTRMVETSCFSP